MTFVDRDFSRMNPFHQMDLLGVVIAILGAVTVVLSCNTSDVRLDPDALIQHISKRSFLFFSCVYVISAIVLAGLSETKTGRDWVFVDVGLCALFGQLSFLHEQLESKLTHAQVASLYCQPKPSQDSLPLSGLLCSLNGSHTPSFWSVRRPWLPSVLHALRPRFLSVQESVRSDT
jgi:hypothetical protein